MNIFDIDGSFTLKRIALIDGGSNICLVPKILIDNRIQLKPCNVSVNGVSGPKELAGFFTANIQISDYTFTDIRVYVIDSNIPVIIGNSLLKNAVTASVTALTQWLRPESASRARFPPPPFPGAEKGSILHISVFEKNP